MGLIEEDLRTFDEPSFGVSFSCLSPEEIVYLANGLDQATLSQITTVSCQAEAGSAIFRTLKGLSER